MCEADKVAMIGEKFGHYRVTAKIGEGGMGTVYLAEHPDIGRKVAVKVLRPEYWDNAESLERLFREAQSTAMLRHPVLVDVIDFGVHATLHCAYVVMEYLEGESLESRITRAGRLPLSMAVEFARQVAIGAGYAHRAGIIHRDLKPANVFIVSDVTRPGSELVKILDFGIAKVTNPALLRGQATRTDAIIGTPLYMAPEQCRGAGKVDSRTDIYALGCILYEMLCGRPPFAYTWPGELIAAHLGEMPASPKTHNPAIPDQLDAIVNQLLAKDPAARYQTMGEVTEEFDRLMTLAASSGAAAGWAWSIKPGAGPTTGSPVPVTQAIGSAPPQAGMMRASATPGMALRSGGVGPITGNVMQPSAGGVLPPAPEGAHHTPGIPPSPKVPLGVDRLVPSRNTTLSKGASEVDSRRSRTGEGTRNRIVIATTLGSAALLAIVGIVVALYPDSTSPRQDAGAAHSSTVMSQQAAASGAAPPIASAPQASDPNEAPVGAAAAAAAHPAAEAPPEPTPPPTPTPPLPSSDGSSPPEVAVPARPARVEPVPRPQRPEVDTIRVSVANPRQGVAVAMDGRAMALPLRLPRDHQQHVLTFSAPKCRPETVTIRADKDTALTLQYRPTLYVP